MRSSGLVCFAVILFLGCGCARFHQSRCGTAESENGSSSSPRTLMAWSGAGKEPKAEDSDANSGADSEKSEEKPIESDRPDFTEASSTVGKGRIQLEAGYTYIRDRPGSVTTHSHSYPEALLRIGALAEWLEFRLGQ